MNRSLSALLTFALATGSGWWLVCLADEPAQDPPPPDLVVLRSGEVITGRVTRETDGLLVVVPAGELRLKNRDVDLVCHSLDEAYEAKCAKVALGRADDHLDLAEWCLRQDLPGSAAKEITAALALDPKSVRAEFLDRRLRQLMATPPAPKAPKAGDVHRVTNEDLDRLVRGMPPSSVEAFTSTIQPLLMNNCATSGCHGPGSKSNYVIIRIPTDRTGNRRITQRNLQSTVQMLDYQNPAQSKLLAAVSRPHGTANSAIFDAQTVKYRQLFLWIVLVTQKAPGAPDVPETPPSVGFPSAGEAADSDNGRTLNSPASDDESPAATIRRLSKVRPPKAPAHKPESPPENTPKDKPEAAPPITPPNAPSQPASESP